MVTVTGSLCSDVDWLAVEFVCGGTPMRIGKDQETLTAAVLAIGYRLGVDVIAERCGTSARQVSRILEANGAGSCPCCKRRLMLQDGMVPGHVNNLGVDCRMAGHHVSDAAWLAAIRSDRRVMKKFS